MFVMDMPDVPPQYAPVVVAQAAQATHADTDRTIGICQAIANNPAQGVLNEMSPLGAMDHYFRNYEHRSIPTDGRVTVLQGPVHGAVQVEEGGIAIFQKTATSERTEPRFWSSRAS